MTSDVCFFMHYVASQIHHFAMLVEQEIKTPTRFHDSDHDSSNKGAFKEGYLISRLSRVRSCKVVMLHSHVKHTLTNNSFEKYQALRKKCHPFF